MRVGAPCQMASFATADFPHFSAQQKPPLDPFRFGGGRRDIGVIHEDAIDRVSDLERMEDAHSKFSGVSSAYSSKSGGGGAGGGKKKRKRRPKRPNPVSVYPKLKVGVHNSSSP